MRLARPGRRCLALLCLAALVTAGLLLAIAFDLSPLLRGPAPYPEWQWSLRDQGSSRGLAMALGCAIGLLALLFLTGVPAAQRRPVLAGALILPLAIGASLGLQLSLLAMEEGESPTDLLIQRTLSPTFTSYFTVALDPEHRDVGSFLRNHAFLLHRLPMHAKTHPPGPVLFYRALFDHFRARPERTEGVVDRIRRAGVHPWLLVQPHQGPALATAFAGASLLLLVANGSCAAVALLAAVLGLRGPAATRVGILWALVPGFALMIPSFDQVLVLPVVLSAALLGVGLRWARTPPMRLGIGFLAGATGGSGLFISYGAGVFVALAGLVVLAAHFERVRRRARETLLLLAAAVAGAALTFGMPVLAGHDPIASLGEALRIHRARFTLRRSYSSWALFNLWDFAVFVGFPVAVVFVWRVARSARDLVSRRSPGIDCGLASVVAAGGLLLLDLSGTVRGEVGRLWLPLMPLVLTTALMPPTPAGPGERDAAAGIAPSSLAMAALAVLLAACAIVLRQTWHLP